MRELLKWSVGTIGASLLILGTLAYHNLAEVAEREATRLQALEAQVQRLQQRQAGGTRVIEHRFHGSDEDNDADDPEGRRDRADAALQMALEQLAAQQRLPASTRGKNGADPDSNKVPVEEIVGARLEEAYDSEVNERQWSEKVGKDLGVAIAALGASDNVESVECKTSLCRLESNFPDIQSYNRFMDSLAGQPSGGDGMISPQVDIHDDGSLHAVSYWVRQGAMTTFTGPNAQTSPQVDPSGANNPGVQANPAGQANGMAAAKPGSHG